MADIKTLSKSSVDSDKNVAKILKSLGYESIESMPTKAELRKIFDETDISLSDDGRPKPSKFTIRNALLYDLYDRGIVYAKNTDPSIQEAFITKTSGKFKSGGSDAASKKIIGIINGLEDAGINLDEPFSVLTDADNIDKIAKVRPSNFIDPKLSGLSVSVENAFTSINKKSPYLLIKDVGAAYPQSRGTKVFQNIPAIEDTAKAFAQGITAMGMPDKNGNINMANRNAVVAATLSVYRPGEIANLRTGSYDVGNLEKPPGYFDIEKGAIIFPENTRGKKTATDLYLDRNSILFNVLEDQYSRVEKAGTNDLFPGVSTGSMTKAVKEHITPLFRPYEGILGRPFDEIKDARKIVFSSLVKSLGPEMAPIAEQLLGHSAANNKKFLGLMSDVASTNYASVVLDQKNPLGTAQSVIEHMWADGLKQPTLNNGASKLGLFLDNMHGDDAVAIPTIKRKGTIGGGIKLPERPLTKGEVNDINATANENAEKAHLRAEKIRLERLELEDTNNKKQEDIQEKGNVKGKTTSFDPVESPKSIADIAANNPDSAKRITDTFKLPSIGEIVTDVAESKAGKVALTAAATVATGIAKASPSVAGGLEYKMSRDEGRGQFESITRGAVEAVNPLPVGVREFEQVGEAVAEKTADDSSISDSGSFLDALTGSLTGQSLNLSGGYASGGFVNKAK